MKEELKYLSLAVDLHKVMQSKNTSDDWENYNSVQAIVDAAYEVCKQTQTQDIQCIYDLSMMLRRMIWCANKETGDTGMKVLAGNAKQLLIKYNLGGSPLRDE